MYIITGTNRHGKRFKPIHTATPWHYNIYNGTVWIVDEHGKRKRVKEIFN